MGLSVASLFGYRSGSLKISPKAWGKLEQAEQAAGLCEKKPVPVIHSVEIAPAPAVEDAASLAGTVAELRDQVRLLTHLVASLLPPPPEGPVGSKKAGDWVQEAREVAGSDLPDVSYLSDEAEAAGLEGLEETTKHALTSAKERESGRAGERESGRAGERESGRAGEREISKMIHQFASMTRHRCRRPNG